MSMLLLSAVAVLPLVAVAALQGLREPRLALAAYAFVVPFGSALGVPGLGELGTLSTAVGAIAGAALAVAVLTRRRPVDRIDPTLTIWWLFLGVVGLSVAWSIAPRTSVRSVLVLTALIGLYSLAAFLPWSSSDRRRLELATVAGGLVVAAYGIGLATTGALALDDKLRFRLAGGGGAGEADANVTAAALLLPLAVALGDLARDDRRAVRIASAGAAAALAVAIVLTGSRGGLLSAGIVALVLWLHGPNRRALGAAVVVALVAGSLTAAAIATDETAERIGERSLSGRTEIWIIGARECLEVCWSGAGIGTFPYVHERGLLRQPDVVSREHRFQAHNVPLQAVVEVGLLGLALLVAVLVLTGRLVLRLPRRLRGPPLAGLAGVLVANLFLSNLDFKYFWLMLTYVLVVTREARDLEPSARATLETVP
jgi:O-antigen ligase